MNPIVRQFVAVALCATFVEAQQLAIAPVRPSGSVIVRPYKASEIPPVRLANSARLGELVRAGALYLTAQDAIALALENNIDLEVARYNPIIAQWNVERSEAGGSLPGVTSNASQAGSVASGQGVSGSQAAAGVRSTGGTSSTGASTNATVSQIGPVTQTLDPAFQEASTFSHTTTPQANVVQSITPILISSTRTHSATYQQGFLSGGSVSLSYTDNYLKENSPTDVLNPSSATNISISAQQSLLRGFGVAVNARTITVNKMNVGTSELTFQSQVISLVTQVLNVYYGLAADYQDLKAKQNAAEVARTFLANVKQQIEVGTLAPTDMIAAQTQDVTSQQAVVDSQATLQKQEITLKALISRSGTADPVLASVRIVPVDPIAIPAADQLPSIEEMVKMAVANRTDLAAERANIQASEISLKGTRNGVQPTLIAFGGVSNAGLSGTAHSYTASDGTIQAPDPYFVGGIGNALGQMFRRNFPTERIGAYYSAPFQNRQAQSDLSIDQLQLRQSQLSTQKDLNQVEVDVMNYVVALRQARARYEAAVRNTKLQQELFAAEQKKYSLGASIPYNVIQQQRDLITAQSAETSSLVTYTSARLALDQTLATTLTVNHVSIAEARVGKVERAPSTPPVAP